jgi:hypothetical protein
VTFSFHRAARIELDDAVDYYEQCESGLGYEFLEEVYATVARLLQYPEAWSRLSRRAPSLPDEALPVWRHLPDQGRPHPHPGSGTLASPTRVLA